MLHVTLTEIYHFFLLFCFFEFRFFFALFRFCVVSFCFFDFVLFNFLCFVSVVHNEITDMMGKKSITILKILSEESPNNYIFLNQIENK